MKKKVEELRVADMEFEHDEMPGCCGIKVIRDLNSFVEVYYPDDSGKVDNSFYDDRDNFRPNEEDLTRQEIKKLKARFNTDLQGKAMLVASTVPRMKGEIVMLEATGWKKLSSARSKTTKNMITLWSYGAKRVKL